MNVVLSYIVNVHNSHMVYIGVKVKKELTRRNLKMTSILNQREYLVVISHQTSSKDA
jgi:hypothetical protein